MVIVALARLGNQPPVTLGKSCSCEASRQGCTLSDNHYLRLLIQRKIFRNQKKVKNFLLKDLDFFLSILTLQPTLCGL
jgi:hypothetical protein